MKGLWIKTSRQLPTYNVPVLCWWEGRMPEHMPFRSAVLMCRGPGEWYEHAVVTPAPSHWLAVEGP